MSRAAAVPGAVTLFETSCKQLPGLTVTTWPQQDGCVWVFAEVFNRVPGTQSGYPCMLSMSRLLIRDPLDWDCDAGRLRLAARGREGSGPHG